MASQSHPQKVVVVGAGPVGALAALYAAARGDDVELYELRGDLRDASTIPLNFTKSINLALSERGINAMRHAGQDDLVESILAGTIPMYGRMIHGEKNGKLFEKAQSYDVHGRAIHAADRGGLNKRLLDALEAMSNVTFFFNHKLTGADFKARKAWFERKPSSTTSEPERAPEIEVPFDFLIGADGAHSAARFHLMKYARVSYQQEYIDTLWSEFHIPPNFVSATAPSTFALSPNHLHIWPGTRFMFIAIPSLDQSFTCTLFAPQSTFDALSRDPSAQLAPFFAANFPGVCPQLISPTSLVAQFSSSPHLPLISIKCAPHHFSSAAVILGDAAHAMVPFYGQGMNAGLEDVRVLFSLLDRHGVYDPSVPARSAPPSLSRRRDDRDDRDARRAEALAAYTRQRATDAAAINDLALRNYNEMRAGVVSPVYLLRKFVEETVSVWMPWAGWRTQYSRVSFSNQRYSEVVREVRRQGIVLLVVGLVMWGVVGGWLAWVVRRRVRAVGGKGGYGEWLELSVGRLVGKRREVR